MACSNKKVKNSQREKLSDTPMEIQMEASYGPPTTMQVDTEEEVNIASKTAMASTQR